MAAHSYRSPGRSWWRAWREALADWFSRFRSVVHFVVWTCVVVYAVQLVFLFLRITWPVGGHGTDQTLIEYLFALSADRVFRLGFAWQLVTYMFLHAGLFHIAVNLLILWFIGSEVESFIGSRAFAWLYALGGIVGGLLWLAFNFHGAGFLVGASAGVLACVVAFATLFPDRELTFLVFFIIPVRLKARYLALILVALDLVPVLERASSNVAHLAHLGGAALGYVFIKQLGYGQTPRWLEAVQSVGRWFRFRRRHAAAPPRRRDAPRGEAGLSHEDFLRRKVDPILDKISREGMQSLSAEERAVLESARDILERRR